MTLAKERTPQSSQSAFVHGFDPLSLEFFSFKGLDEGGCSEDHIPTFKNPSNSSSVGFVNSLAQDQAHSIVNFKATTDHWAYSSSSSVLSFEQGDQLPHVNYPKLDQEEECPTWIDTMDRDYQMNHLNSRLARDANCFEMASDYDFGEERFGLLYPSATDNDFQEGGEMERGFQKRPYMGGDMQSQKKHCGNSRKAKVKPSSSKDPQSIAAKNRRERISERLKILQDLVPNGTKVDLVTMLEKAVSYVKFLQLQVKVLATDEFWPTQGGKAPEAAQVKVAIDAILSSHRDRNSSSKQ